VRLARATPAILVAGALAGCATTQQEATRLQLNSARIRASQVAVHVRRRNPAVRVSAVALLRSGRRMAIVVRVRNLAERTLTDLPVSVGVTAPHGLRRYLNDRAGIDYFDAHLSAIAPRAELTWVFTSSATVPVRARPFADVGIPTPGFSSATRLPQITAELRRGSGARHILRLTIRNDSAVPQYQLPVYATVSGRRGFLAAGAATIAHLGTGASTSLQMALLGSATKATPALEVPPTIFG
jgi:hypothetical protein